MENQNLPAGCIGHVDDFKLENGELDYEGALAGKHIDGESGLVFESEEARIAWKHPEEAPVEEVAEQHPAEGEETPEGIAHYLTAQDFQLNPEFTEQGLKEGDLIFYAKPEELAEVKE